MSPKRGKSKGYGTAEHEFVPNVLEKARPRKSQSFIRCQELEWKRKCTRTT